MGERRPIGGLRQGGEEFTAEASLSQLEQEGERILAARAWLLAGVLPSEGCLHGDP